MDRRKMIDDLFAFLEEATSPYHTVEAARSRLETAGFQELQLGEAWTIERGGAYYIKQQDSCMIAFTVGESSEHRRNFRFTACHTDFPGFRIKNKPEVVKDGYGLLNTEPYGGIIRHSWLDRPLSVAGRVTLRSESIFHPETQLIDLKKPVLLIPSLAIHMNRDVNKGVELDLQKDMLPLVSLSVDEKRGEDFFMNVLAEELHCDPKDILDYELQVYNADTADLVGLQEELISAPRLDNVTSAQAMTYALIHGRRHSGINVACYFDHEEIGSKTIKGAGSIFTEQVLLRIYESLGMSQSAYYEALAESMLLSVDVAHAHHPSYPDRSDITAKAKLGEGFCIKENSAQSYVTDSRAIGILMQLCDASGISYQKVSKRSGPAGGGTLANIFSAYVPVIAVDCGVPLLAMHSSRELMGASDQLDLIAALTNFYQLAG